jgi:hypothetical protein
MNIIEALGITKGPWEMRESLGEHWVTDFEGDTVACASAVYPECTITLDRDEAQLIATAPKLLDLLDKIIEAQYNPKKSLSNLNGAISNAKDYLIETWPEIKQLYEEVRE